MLKAALFFFFASSFFLISCESRTISKKTYLDIDSLINAQINSLVAAKARVSKTATLGDVKDQSEFLPDSLGWATELDVFRQLDVINKPTNKDAYLITDSEKDTNSNLTTRSYQAKSELPVRLLKLYYYKDLKNLKKIEALFAEKNTLYYSKRSLTMDFDEIAGNNMLINYSINGTQKMIVSDTVRFTVQCAIVF